ncbi:MAG: ArnT family glycosyltransferase [Candidatus Promineifilaceae bacterium]
MDAGFTLGLVGLLIVIMLGIGLWVLKVVRMAEMSTLERFLFAIGLGSGVLALIILGLIAGGWLKMPVAFCLIGVLIFFFGLPGITLLEQNLRNAGRVFKQVFTAGIIEKLILLAAVLILLLTFLHSLGPVTDYDGLMYHLPGPRAFLQAESIELLPEMWQANGPLTGEMLFTIGLVFGSDSSARLIHFSFALFWLCGVYALGKRFVNSNVGILAVLILFGTPMIFYWAQLAYIDYIWCFYELLGFYGFLRWHETRRIGWLVLTGLSIGFALGSKYLAIWSFSLPSNSRLNT